MYCLRLFIVFLQELHRLQQSLLLLIVVRSFKSMCIPSLVLIGSCVSFKVSYPSMSLSVMYGLRLFIVVLQELHCLQRVAMVVMEFYQCVKFHFLINSERFLRYSG